MDGVEVMQLINKLDDKLTKKIDDNHKEVKTEINKINDTLNSFITEIKLYNQNNSFEHKDFNERIQCLEYEVKETITEKTKPKYEFLFETPILKYITYIFLVGLAFGAGYGTLALLKMLFGVI